MKSAKEIISEAMKRRDEFQYEISKLNSEVEELRCPICGEPFDALEYIVQCAGGCERYICQNCAVDMEDEYVCVNCNIGMENDHAND